MNKHYEKEPLCHALGIGEFKERCLDVIDEVSRGRGNVVIVDGDEPVAELSRYVELPNPARGAFKDIKILGDIEGPMPVEWYTDPNVLTDDDWDISGPMPASWFVDPDEGKPREYRKPDKVDVSILHRHKLLTLDTDEFVAQLDEVIEAITESRDGKVIIFFDDEDKPLVQAMAIKGHRYDVA